MLGAIRIVAAQPAPADPAACGGQRHAARPCPVVGEEQRRRTQSITIRHTQIISARNRGKHREINMAVGIVNRPHAIRKLTRVEQIKARIVDGGQFRIVAMRGRADINEIEFGVIGGLGKHEIVQALNQGHQPRSGALFHR